MTTIIIGLFPTQENAKNLAADLEKNGFRVQDYIVYLTKPEYKEQNFWEKLFGERTPQINTNETDKLIASVSIDNEQQLEIAKNIFAQHSVEHTYEFDDVTIVEAQNLDYLKAKVALRAKSEVYSTQLKNKKTAQNIHQGAGAEFSFDAF
ncbi:hypothetical protein [Frigoriflavimonas asaccharolytica]|uniref:Uncharacterized protein n=1 Tax=Frigoriflavimonas asaccharolytica TaxID=2735899 RepID=A0A8J8G6T2_9FLAO|nr:hypothetical protein [Frigoriflavimonas asaccharolytica]NRS92061.1 hypothetical protein [Frigoriflavimonas asaccharolytica]